MPPSKKRGEDSLDIRFPLIAIVGRPNVGKSTLFNRLVGGRSALVHDEPGVTRDRRYGSIFWDGMSFELIDTGGFVPIIDRSLANKVAMQSVKAIGEAELVLLMADGREGLLPDDRDLVQAVRKTGKPVFLVVNKIDSAQREAAVSDFARLGMEVFPISAEVGRGIGELLDGITQFFRNKGGAESPEPPQQPDKKLTVTVAGRPNVGKSTLINRLSADDRLVVDDQPGTTRDPVEVGWKGTDFVLVDTAGIRRRGRIDSAVEKFSVIKALNAVAKGSICLILIDATEGVTAQDAHLVGEVFQRGKAAVILVNKWDAAKGKMTKEKFSETLQRKMAFAWFYPLLYVSARTGAGLSRLPSLLNELKEEYSKKIHPGVLREALDSAVDSHPPPQSGGRPVLLGPIRQTGTSPPTFVVNKPAKAKLHFSYERYLTESLRRSLGLSHSPIRLFFRSK